MKFVSSCTFCFRIYSNLNLNARGQVVLATQVEKDWIESDTIFVTETSIFCVPSLSLKLYNHKSLAVFISFIALVLWNHTFPTSLPEFNNRVRWHVMCFSLFPILRQYWIDVLTFTAMILTYARADAIGNSGLWWLLLDKICLNSVLFFHPSSLILLCFPSFPYSHI